MKSSYKVLIVNDKKTLAELKKKILQKLGIDSCVLTEKTEIVPDKVVEKLRSAEYDLVLLDFDLGGHTGIDVLRKLRQAKLDVPVLVISATTPDTPDFREELIQEGAIGFMGIPSSPREWEAFPQKILEYLIDNPCLLGSGIRLT